jgi:hypothetical protein
MFINRKFILLIAMFCGMTRTQHPALIAILTSWPNRRTATNHIVRCMKTPPAASSIGDGLDTISRVVKQENPKVLVDWFN